jgi:hypothetical protein
MTKTTILATAVVALGLSMAGITASYAANGDGNAGQEARNDRAIHAQQAAQTGPTHVKSLEGNEQAIAGALSQSAAPNGDTSLGRNQGALSQHGFCKTNLCPLAQ